MILHLKLRINNNKNLNCLQVINMWINFNKLTNILIKLTYRSLKALLQQIDLILDLVRLVVSLVRINKHLTNSNNNKCKVL